MKSKIKEMDHIKLGMSNFDYSIDPGLDEALKKNEGKSYAQYSGWDFCGYVWYLDNQFHCEVWTYGSPKEVISADSLPEIIKLVSSSYGWK